MSPELVQFFILTGLRALVEYDPAEYRRMTDLSKSEIDRKLNELVQLVADTEAKELHQSLRNAISEIANPEQLRFFLTQTYNTAIQKAQYQAMLYIKTDKMEVPTWSQIDVTSVKIQSRLSTQPDRDFTRLAVMRLLRIIPNYTPLFEYRLQNARLDCVWIGIVNG